MEETFAAVARFANLLVQAAAVLVVFYGAAEAFGRLVWIGIGRSASHRERKALWRRFGVWLLLGLEFDLELLPRIRLVSRRSGG